MGPQYYYVIEQILLDEVYGRSIGFMQYAELNITGMNAVAPGQISSMRKVLMYKSTLCTDTYYKDSPRNSWTINFHPKPVGDWNGSGCHPISLKKCGLKMVWIICNGIEKRKNMSI